MSKIMIECELCGELTSNYNEEHWCTFCEENILNDEIEELEKWEELE